MSLKDEVKKLRGLEQATREDTEISSPIDDSDYLERLVDVAPAMLEVLSMIHEGDRAAITEAINHLRKLHSTDPERNKTIRGLDEPLLRFQQMAALMEKEEQ